MRFSDVRRWRVLLSAAILMVGAAAPTATPSLAQGPDSAAAAAPPAVEATAGAADGDAGRAGAAVPLAARNAALEAAIPAAARARPGVPFSPEAATAAYLATVPAEARARSDAYFEGGYWLILWNYLASSAIALALLHFGLSRRMRDRAERVTRLPAVHAFLYWAQYVVLTSVLAFPLTWYAGFQREHAYGLATQGFGAWMAEQGKGLALAVVLGGVVAAVMYALVRRLPRSWPLWGTAAALGFLVLGAMVAPVYLVPMFNRVSRLEAPAVRAPILRLARASGIAAGEVYVVDASRQSTRVSANVSGMLGTERITLNDNLLNRASLPEIESVMGHEMGHYVLNHVYESLPFFALVIGGGFCVLAWGFERARARWGERWGVRGVADPAGLPLLGLIFGTYLLVQTPLLNTYVRANEQEADAFGLHAARQPDGFAQVSLKLGEYRKLEPTPLEEWIFFDHPSGRTRILTAMRWKAENPSPRLEPGPAVVPATP